MVFGVHLSIHDGEPLVDPTQYQSLVGALQYYTFTCPDINFSVDKLYQFMHAPTYTHLQAAKRPLRYLKGTMNHGIVLSSSSVALTCFTDADWARCSDDRRSTSGLCVFLGSSLVSWGSSKQRVVSRSSAESEYREMSNSAAVLLWIQSLLSEISFCIYLLCCCYMTM